MGTNYYLIKHRPCAHCKRGYEEGLHIGKSSMGWNFALRVYPLRDGHSDYHLKDHDIPAEAITRLEDWIPLFKQYGVVDEYKDEITPAEMLEIITDRRKRGSLQRHNVDGTHCIAHGPGTYDFMIGEFS